MRIPAELKAIPRWVTWKTVRDEKKHFCCRTGKPAKVNDPATWTDFATASAYARKRGLGLGFAFVGDDICGVDLDDCRDPASGKLRPWASDLVRSFDTYT